MHGISSKIALCYTCLTPTLPSPYFSFSLLPSITIALPMVNKRASSSDLHLTMSYVEL